MNLPIPNERPPLAGIKLIILTVAVAMATFMQVIDATIANVAVPTIAGNLGASYSQGTWVITTYGVANAIALPLSGRLGQRFGEVRLFNLSAALFALTSLACGLATNLNFLIVCRVLQGALGAPIMPLAQTLLMNNYPRRLQMLAIGLWATTVSVAPVIGPIMGGYISDNYHWGWIFLINVPIGAVVVILSHLVLSDRETKLSRPRWSAISFSLLVLGVGSLQLFLDRGRELDWFNSPQIVTLAVLAVVGITLLLIWESRNPEPLLDLSVFRSRNFSVGLGLIGLGMMLYLGMVVLLPLMLQRNFGFTATWAGIATSPVGLLPILAGPIIGRFGSKFDQRYLISFGFAVFLLLSLYRSNFAPQADLWFVFGPQIVLGAGIACFFVPITSLSFIGMAPDKVASAAGLFNCVRTLFGAIGASAVTTIWERREALHHARLAGHIDPFNPQALETLNTLTNLGMSQEQAAGFVARQITNQGFILAGAEFFKLCAICYAFMIALTWLAKPFRAASILGKD
ncbi:MAG: DHA2 family efflux MFS transporter permease subunit [Deltaproteobacteria bacterium]|jgi:DHA2 family multidrug resistance protein|nr:DHA2 family efflux MFS transporter permease subunit [Deltaproteobacteria bacterium]